MTRRHTLLLIALLAFGLALRLWNLGHSAFSTDELVTLQWIQPLATVPDVFAHILKTIQWAHRLPLLALILHGLLLYGRPDSTAFISEWVARLPFALIGAATLPLLYGLGRLLRDRVAGLWCLFLGAGSVFHVYYSRECYDYALLIFFIAGTLMTAVGLMQHWLDRRRFHARWAAAYAMFAVGLLQTHLSGLLFLAPLNALMGLTLLLRAESRTRLDGRRIAAWAATFGVAYVFFLPFLLAMRGGFTATEMIKVKGASWAILPGVLGRMGWGESPWALVPFVLCVGLGVWTLCGVSRRPGAVAALDEGGPTVARERNAASRNKSGSTDKSGRIEPTISRPPAVARLGWLLIGATLIYAVAQTWLLRVSRFEIRYYAPLFPLLLVCAALGLTSMLAAIGARLPFLRPAWLHGVAAAGLLMWLAPSLDAVVRLEARGNYRMIARWIHAHLPENGIYAYYNVYELRGVPGVYPTPGRFAAFPVPWDGAEGYRQRHIRERMMDFFRRFPRAAYIEPMPEDLLAPPAERNEQIVPLPREALFARRDWLEDPWIQRLVRLKTYPQGAAQWYSTVSDRVMISYNRPEDLAPLARRRGETCYHDFGPEWRYHKDEQYNDWLVLEREGRIVAGNATEQSRKATLKMKGLIPRHGGTLTLTTAAGDTIAQWRVGAQFQEYALPDIALQPGDNVLTLRCVSASAQGPSVFLLAALEVVAQ